MHPCVLKDDRENRLACHDREVSVGAIERLDSELAKLKTHPCGTELVFYHWGLSFADWFVTCPGCSSVPADRVFSKQDIEDLLSLYLDGYYVDREVVATDLLQYQRLCY